MKLQTASMILLLLVLPMMSVFGGTWYDDFEDNKISEWEIYNLDKQLEKWWIEDGEAVGEIFIPPFWSLWLTGEDEWEFYSVSCRGMVELDREEPPTIGVILHDGGDQDSRYVFTLDYVHNIARIIKDVEGGGSVAHPFEAENGVWYDLKATVKEDGTLVFRINDTVFSAIDPKPLSGGKAGLLVGDARARFDNVAISGDNIRNGGPGKPFDVAPQSKLATTWGKLKVR